MPDQLPPVVVLCGGLGTRLRPVVSDRPKVLAEVAGRPFLGWLLDHLRREGAREVVLSAGHLAGQVEAFVAAEAPAGLAVRTVVEPQPLGTGGALRHASAAAGIAGPFLALNGDTFFSGSLARLAAEHAARGAAATLALVRVPHAGRYGAVRFDAAAGVVEAFEEKGAAGPGWINAGAYALAPDALAALVPGRPASFERDVLPGLVARVRVAAVPYPDAAFLDIGTPADYARAAALLAPAAP
jgi:D-glycero-alpha-D-manno-heptose 1-phosphate guanylyltransferase